MNNCKICGEKTQKLFQKTILKKYSSHFYECVNCGFIQTDEPVWLKEAYTDAISTMDTGIFIRNRKFAAIVPIIISIYFNKTKKFLDFGAGYGILVRMMRDKGFDYYWQDEYCENIFARQYGLTTNLSAKFELLTAFEVFEHLENPKLELEKMLKFSDSILFSTNIIPRTNIENWWYLSPETGQHIALYSLKSLKVLGEQYNLNFYSNGHNFHLFTKKNLNPFVFHALSIVKKAITLIKGNENTKGYQIDRENSK